MKSRLPFKGITALLQEIRFFNTKSLKKVPVYFVNNNTQNTLIPFHGYFIAGEPASENNRRNQGKSFRRLSTDIMKAPYYVTDELYHEALKLNISNNVKIALKKLVRTYPYYFYTVEYFVRALLEAQGTKSKDIEKELVDIHPDIKQLIALNKKCNGISGSYAPTSVLSKSTQDDQKMFDQGTVEFNKIDVS